jgi:hypothetical protein
VTNKADNVKDILAIHRAANGGLIELAKALHHFLDTYTSWPDSPSREKGKRILTDAFLREDCPPNERRIVERVFDLLWKMPVGGKRKIGPPKRADGKAYRKAYAIISFETMWKRDNQNMTDQEVIHRLLTLVGEKVSNDPIKRKKQFNKIRNRLREARKLNAEWDRRSDLVGTSTPFSDALGISPSSDRIKG